jgi:hypothetical protein
VTPLGPNWGAGEYTGVIALSPDDRYLYYAPGSHGQATRYGTPVVQFDLAARRRKVLAFLNPPLREQLRYNVGGTYCLSVSPDGDRIYVVFNGAPVPEQPARREETFGQPSLAVIDIPASERAR